MRFLKNMRKCEMEQQISEHRKSEIKSQIKEISKLLSMLPSDEAVKMQEPVAKNEMELSVWLENARDKFLKLSVLISEEVDIGIAETNLKSDGNKRKAGN